MITVEVYQMDDCIFCKIINGEISSTKVYEDENFLVIKDINPVAPVHDLVLYKRHIRNLNELTNEHEDFSKIFEVIKKVAELEKISNGYRVVVNNGEEAGQEINHIHFHVIGGRKLGKIA
ncbi:MAG: histidine triad family protein [Thermotogaceae bacterium]|jgi:histidine triad (HIT) family protein|nr:histidine triad family protein [Thermotogaceae bacterium]MDN5337978.1 histidine triad family protein [Thermotogaceae bacterium]